MDNPTISNGTSDDVDSPISLDRVPDFLREGFDAVQGLTEEQATKLFFELSAASLELLRRRVQLIFYFEQRGWNVKKLGNGHTYFYKMMAHQQLLMELFVALSVRDPGALGVVVKLPIGEQRRMVKNEEVRVLVGFKEDGQPYFKEMPLLDVPPGMLASLTKGGTILDEGQQIANARRKQRLPAEPKIGSLVPDLRRRGAISKIGNVSIFHSLAQLEAVITQIRTEGL